MSNKTSLQSKCYVTKIMVREKSKIEMISDITMSKDY